MQVRSQGTSSPFHQQTAGPPDGSVVKSGPTDSVFPGLQLMLQVLHVSLNAQVGVPLACSAAAHFLLSHVGSIVVLLDMANIPEAIPTTIKLLIHMNGLPFPVAIPPETPVTA